MRRRDSCLSAAVHICHQRGELQILLCNASHFLRWACFLMLHRTATSIPRWINCQDYYYYYDYYIHTHIHKEIREETKMASDGIPVQLSSFGLLAHSSMFVYKVANLFSAAFVRWRGFYCCTSYWEEYWEAWYTVLQPTQPYCASAHTWTGTIGGQIGSVEVPEAKAGLWKQEYSIESTLKGWVHLLG